MHKSWEAAKKASPEKLVSQTARFEEAVDAVPPSPWDEAGTWSRLSFSFVRPLLRASKERELDAASLPSVPARDRVPEIAKRIELAWSREVARASRATEARRAAAAAAAETGAKDEEAGSSAEEVTSSVSPSFRRALGTCFLPEILAQGAGMFVEYACVVAQAALVGPLVDWFAASSRPSWEGLCLGLGLVLCSAAQAVAHHWAFYVGMRMGSNQGSTQGRVL